jgi:hypothetical protein
LDTRGGGRWRIRELLLYEEEWTEADNQTMNGRTRRGWTTAGVALSALFSVN